MVFHDDFLSIFPDYWVSVPANYEYIAVGMIPRHFNISEKTVYGEQPHCKALPSTASGVLYNSAWTMQGCMDGDQCTSERFEVACKSLSLSQDCWVVMKGMT